jgi:glycine cleavage system H protein
LIIDGIFKLKIIKMNFPDDVKYTRDHEWLKMNGSVGIVGITDFAQKELGDIVYVDIGTVGQSVNAGDVFGTVEAVKTVSDLFMPVSGKILEFNKELEKTPEAVNTDPYGAGWMVKIEISDTSQVDELLSSEKYQALIQ